jgi:hypothetical protein
MRSFLLALLLGSAMAFFGAHRAARADTGSSFPTATATRNPPAGAFSHRPPRPVTSTNQAPAAAELLLRMRAAIVQRGSVHVDFSMVSALYPTGEASTHLQGDVSWRLNLLHDRTTVLRTDAGHVAKVPLQSIDLRLVHERAASHNLVGGWQCENLAHVQVMSTLLGLEESVLSEYVVGTGVVNGTSVWVIRATGYSPATGSGSIANIVYDVSRADDTLQRVQVTGSSSFKGRTQQIVASEAYTHYGEPVNVQLPAVCSVR